MQQSSRMPSFSGLAIYETTYCQRVWSQAIQRCLKASPKKNLRSLCTTWKNELQSLTRTTSLSWLGQSPVPSSISLYVSLLVVLVDWRMKRRTHARRQERLMDDPVAVGSLRLQIYIWPCLLLLLESASVIVNAQKSPFSQILHQLPLLSHCKVP